LSIGIAEAGMAVHSKIAATIAVLSIIASCWSTTNAPMAPELRSSGPKDTTLLPLSARTFRKSGHAFFARSLSKAIGCAGLLTPLELAGIRQVGQ
jgi:hypothetical protein